MVEKVGKVVVGWKKGEGGWKTQVKKEKKSVIEAFSGFDAPMTPPPFPFFFLPFPGPAVISREVD